MSALSLCHVSHVYYRRISQNRRFLTLDKGHVSDAGTIEDGVTPAINVPSHTPGVYTLGIALNTQIMAVTNVDSVQGHEDSGGIEKVGTRE